MNDARCALTFPFDRVLAPIPVRQFLDTYYEQQTLVVRRNAPDYYEPLLSLEALDDFLSARPPLRARVDLVDARRDISPDEYVRPDGRVDVARLYDCFDRGATITFRQMHDCFPALADLCRAAEILFNCPFQTNLYFTPPNAQGFKTHYDTHDVFVLQIAGSKRWRVYDPIVVLPLPDQHFDPAKHSLGPVVDEFVLRAGDLFYCPRGIPHEADSTNEISLHVTFGALAYSWAEVLIEAVADACLNDVAFRHSLPPGFAVGRVSAEALQETFRALVDRFRTAARLEPALDSIADRFVRKSAPLVPQQRLQLSKLGSLTIDSEVGCRPSLVYRSHITEETFTVEYHSSEIRFPIRAAAPVTYALSTPRFVVRDLPGEIDDSGKLVLIRRLVREGCAVVLDS
jgi:ribosomal protein L16 Arg81 hydroxylase